MNATCDKCGGPLRMMPLPTYEPPNRKRFGGMRVILVNGSVSAPVCCEEIKGDPEIPDLQGLIAAVCVTRAKDPLKLNGGEIRFMRKAIELSAKHLAEILDVSQETISRWESKSQPQPIGGANEKLFRYLVCRKLAKLAPAIAYDMNEILQLPIRARIGTEEDAVLCFERTRFKKEVADPPKPVWMEDEKKAA